MISFTYFNFFDLVRCYDFLTEVHSVRIKGKRSGEGGDGGGCGLCSDGRSGVSEAGLLGGDKPRDRVGRVCFVAAAVGGLNRKCLLKMSFPLLLMTLP